jgi:5-methylcytosine-specific restriction endonuclease McrA
MLLMRHLALYGSVQIVRDTCPECKRPAFILDGEFACCGTPANDEAPVKYKRMSTGSGIRQLPPISVRKAVLEEQEHCCFYCGRRLGEFYFRRGKPTRARIEWDHLAPFSYVNSNPIANFVAACRECNRAKGSLMFQTVEEARIYVKSRVSGV